MAGRNKPEPFSFATGGTGTVAETGTAAGSDSGGNAANLGNAETGKPQIVDPVTLTGGSGEPGATEPRRRGRPKGSTNRPKETAPPTDIGAIQAVLLSVHGILAFK